MRDRSSSSLFSTPVQQTASQWAPRIILLSLGVIVVSTLYPFKFSPFESSFLRLNRTSGVDIVANVVLFMPLGFGLASALASRKASSSTKLLATLFLGGSLSLIIEILQAFLPGRYSALSDVLTNAIGAGVGYWWFEKWGEVFYQRVPPVFRWFQGILDRLKLQHLVLAIIVYAGLAAVLASSWPKLSLLSWDIDQPLLIGGKDTVKLPNSWGAQAGQEQTVVWNGTIADLVISDRGLSHEQINTLLSSSGATLPNSAPALAVYPLTNHQSLQDRTGQSPDLKWQGGTPTFSKGHGVQLSGTHWLATDTPVTLINQAIRDSAQFTLSVTLTTTAIDPSQFLDAPILAIGPVPATSSSFTQRWKDSNFVLSQIGTDLLLRMKTSRAGWDRHGYTAYIPGVFSDAKPHQLQISYAGFALRVYIDGRERSLLFDVTPNRYQIVFYVLILVPFALLLSLVANRIPGRLGYLVLVVGSAILPSLVLEELLVSAASRSIRATNVVLGFLIIGGTILTLRRLPAPSGGVKRTATPTS